MRDEGARQWSQTVNKSPKLNIKSVNNKTFFYPRLTKLKSFLETLGVKIEGDQTGLKDLSNTNEKLLSQHLININVNHNYD